MRAGLALAGLGLAAGCGVLPPSSSGAPKVPRIGYIGMASSGARNADTLADGLRELGYVDGQNVRLEWRLADGRQEREEVAVRAARTLARHRAARAESAPLRPPESPAPTADAGRADGSGARR